MAKTIERPILLLHVLALGALASLAGAQTFEVASVKTAAPGTRYAMRGGPGGSDPGQITYTRVTLRSMLTKAYGIEGYQLAGPSWIEQERYDVAAKVPPGATKEEFRQMLRNLLAGRFGLVAHGETRELPIYALVVGKNGVKMQVSRPEQETGPEGPPVTSVSLANDGLPVMPAGYKDHLIGMSIAGKTMLRAKGESLEDFAKFLSGDLDRPVFDRTGLTATYDFGIAWSSDQALAHESQLPPTLEPGPDVFTALQQLGLKLEPRREPVEMVVVDHLEKVPSAN